MKKTLSVLYPFAVFDSNPLSSYRNDCFPKYNYTYCSFWGLRLVSIPPPGRKMGDDRLRKSTKWNNGSPSILWKFLHPTARIHCFNEKHRRYRSSLRPACIDGEALGQEIQLSGLSDYHPDYSYTVKAIQKEAYGLGSDGFALVCVSFCRVAAEMPADGNETQTKKTTNFKWPDYEHLYPLHSCLSATCAFSKRLHIWWEM